MSPDPGSYVLAYVWRCTLCGHGGTSGSERDALLSVEFHQRDRHGPKAPVPLGFDPDSPANIRSRRAALLRELRPR